MSQKTFNRNPSITGAAFEELWKHLGGAGIRGKRSVAFWRSGKRQSVSINIERGLWHDHAAGDGGDAIALVKTVLNVGIGESLAWLEREGYRQPSQRMTALEVAAHRRKREEAERRRIAVADFRAALDAELDRLKLATAESGDDAGLERAASLQFALAQSPEAVFSDMLERDAGRVGWLLAKGREDRQDAARITAVIVDLLAAAQGQEGTHDRAA